MNNIKTDSDVSRWAEEIVASKGTKYTPLSKSDLFAIAAYIVKTDNSEKPVFQPEPPPPPEEPPAVPEREETPTADETKPIDAPHDAPMPSTDKAETVQMVRSYALRKAGFTAQQAFDRFLQSKEEQPDSKVMNFANGKICDEAAFAYWLSEVLTVPVPKLKSPYCW